ncbi:hypothetical protein DDB_G0285501 [Dictyostelium discoideum AX4]|uniref:Prolyl 4-hydroxylase alpha subunit domain-containing protein n=1 Tax=Dictyostelium discoideum TaxID=44689 RepID=Q54N51_DICDI|nr:hypothetical protein DDB_G0285501 [Dictyostelium discoideum AX4]EAL64588.1 hypothetical protein DDB_G0285501 [Dictyostelium discoideum AX4]|eukprot:XP_638092.1 hypothetical protein DDB_G0285501 [Dictyostelium discoideum AX4]
MAQQRSIGHYMKEPSISISNSFDLSKITKKDLWGGGFILHNALSEEECKYFIEEAEKIGWESLHWQRGEKNDFRINDRIMVMSEDIARFAWERVENFLNDNGLDITTTVKPGDGLYKIGSPSGVWKPIGLNPKFRMCKYYKGGLFKKHYDGSYVQSSTKRSLYTFMFYLNQDYTGGATNFLDDQSLKSISSVLHFKDTNTGTGNDLELNDDDDSLKAVDLQSLKVIDVVGPLKTGNLVVFPQDLFHEGSPVLDGIKYIMRTDVMFEKIADINTDQPVDPEAEAERLLVMAEELERSGSTDESIKMYKKAFSLSKNLASKYGF